MCLWSCVCAYSAFFDAIILAFINAYAHNRCIKTAIALRAIALPITFNHIRNNLMSNQSEPLSRRDQLAAAVMQGIITANAGKRVGSYEMAETAVKHADALITALAKIQA